MGLKGFLLSAAFVASLQGVHGSIFAESTPKVAAYLNGGGQGLATFCQNPNVDIIQLAFVDQLDTEPQSTSLSGIQGWEITQCQTQGKTILVSLGGATYHQADKNGGWSTPELASQMADKLWNKYGPGSNGQGPFGTAVIDGFDFDFEVPMTNLPAFTNRLITLKSQLTKPFYLTAAPQCQWPDKNLQTVLDTNMGAFDAIFVQFYNNQECGIGAGYQRRSQGPSARRSGLLGNFNLAHWLTLAGESNTETNSNFKVDAVTAPGSGGKSNKPKIFVGVPGGTAGTETPNSGYVDVNTLKQAIQAVTSTGSANFGGVSIWSLQVAVSNGNFLANVKSMLNSWTS
ncbi:uncharacterized protein N7496_004907 [Penicillium cataractarum]|uniref:chitinase n=1 Tax=Penicillium cataractarum TaxID=2100454 RepID=A0A9W9VCX7_9EURO|nr:uncharacterized protein N7496_004907 [Penicillium cataractarum]KAJ5377498.1 hypothetical protein N7496_004907 [Penicillium cataractarum]